VHPLGPERDERLALKGVSVACNRLYRSGKAYERVDLRSPEVKGGPAQRCVLGEMMGTKIVSKGIRNVPCEGNSAEPTVLKIGLAADTALIILLQDTRHRATPSTNPIFYTVILWRVPAP